MNDLTCAGMVLLLDNCDNVLEEDEDSFIRFTRDLLRQIKKNHKCKVSVYIHLHIHVCIGWSILIFMTHI